MLGKKRPFQEGGMKKKMKLTHFPTLARNNNPHKAPLRQRTLPTKRIHRPVKSTVSLKKPAMNNPSIIKKSGAKPIIMQRNLTRMPTQNLSRPQVTALPKHLPQQNKMKPPHLTRPPATPKSNFTPRFPPRHNSSFKPTPPPPKNSSLKSLAHNSRKTMNSANVSKYRFPVNNGRPSFPVRKTHATSTFNNRTSSHANNQYKQKNANTIIRRGSGNESIPSLDRHTIVKSSAPFSLHSQRKPPPAKSLLPPRKLHTPNLRRPLPTRTKPFIGRPVTLHRSTGAYNTRHAAATLPKNRSSIKQPTLNRRQTSLLVNKSTPTFGKPFIRSSPTKKIMKMKLKLKLKVTKKTPDPGLMSRRSRRLPTKKIELPEVTVPFKINDLIWGKRESYWWPGQILKLTGLTATARWFSNAINQKTSQVSIRELRHYKPEEISLLIQDTPMDNKKKMEFHVSVTICRFLQDCGKHLDTSIDIPGKIDPAVDIGLKKYHQNLNDDDYKLDHDFSDEDENEVACVGLEEAFSLFKDLKFNNLGTKPPDDFFHKPCEKIPSFLECFAVVS